jgi:hypothetical protein
METYKMKFEELPKCAVCNQQKYPMFMFGTNYLCGDCAVEYVRKKDEQIMKEIKEVLKNDKKDLSSM